jgi:hypothetical protein
VCLVVIDVTVGEATLRTGTALVKMRQSPQPMCGPLGGANQASVFDP